jgi:hypothetical protein
MFVRAHEQNSQALMFKKMQVGVDSHQEDLRKWVQIGKKECKQE